MAVTLSMKHAVSVWIGQTLKHLDELEILGVLEVEWNERFTSKMGSAKSRRLTEDFLLRFSAPLWPRATPTERHETVIHEVCHLVAQKRAWARGVKIQPHGPEWEQLMRECSIEPERTHSVSNEGLTTRRRVKVSCKCGTFSVTPYVAGRIAAGATYRCRKCSVKISAPAGTKPVERRKKRRRRRRLSA
jgi:SprT protein